MDEPRRMLLEVIRKAIQEGKLFELIFTENGKRLWQNTVRNEEELKMLIRKIIKEVR